ncbi:hypothetical protein HD597_007161 [Nonomuraea thailandensis]|uniref:Uncharacterized protein n=1 Tax=Nonomuraea thailandensis TaxID=1188745 RepID=A0A9X2GJQ0_9ACTN|nr:hypothetical protein [Nonomuraea thailandensis]MCP2360141.1 hypothetical protein [Nonomuraea thailandensis]
MYALVALTVALAVGYLRRFGIPRPPVGRGRHAGAGPAGARPAGAQGPPVVWRLQE